MNELWSYEIINISNIVAKQTSLQGGPHLSHIKSAHFHNPGLWSENWHTGATCHSYYETKEGKEDLFVPDIIFEF